MCERLEHPPSKSGTDVIIFESVIGRVGLLKLLQEIDSLFSIRDLQNDGPFSLERVRLPRAPAIPPSPAFPGRQVPSQISLGVS